MSDRVPLTELEVITRFSLAVRAATADRDEVIAALRADLAWLEGPVAPVPAAPSAAPAPKAAPSRKAAATQAGPGKRAAPAKKAAPATKAASRPRPAR